MKKVLLLSLSLVMGLCAFAQQTAIKQLPVSVEATLEKKAFGNDVVEGTATFVATGTQSVVTNANYEYMEAEALYTTYDMQSNGFLANRMYQAKDGSVAVTATMSRSEFDPGFLDRGTGYNFADRGKVGKFGGISGIRVEAKTAAGADADVRTGWPTIAPYGAEGEILVSHGHEKGLSYYIREKAGEGLWDGPHAIPNPEDIDEVVKGKNNTLAWPRIVTTGENNEVLHVFAAASGDSNVAQYYIRTADLKEWDIQYSPLEMDDLHINFYAADDYAVSANGDNIAVVYCGGFSAHVMAYESNDGGLTWNSRMVWESPIHDLDWETDSTTLFDKLYGPTHASVAIGKDGVTHVALGVGLYKHATLGLSYNLYYGLITDGVAYWNDTTAWDNIVEEMVLTVKDSTEKYNYSYDTTYTVVDSTEKYNYSYDTTGAVVDSTLVYEYAYDTTYSVVDSTEKYNYSYDTTGVVVDSTLVYEYLYDTTGAVVDSTVVYDYTYETNVTVDSTVVYDYVYETNVTVDSTLVYEYAYDTAYVTDTVAMLSPIRSPQDDSLKHALRLWWNYIDEESGEEFIRMNLTNFCAFMPGHETNGYNEFDASKQYTGSTQNTAGDYLSSFGVTAYPSIAVDPAGNLAVAYSSPDMNRDVLYSNNFYLRTIFVNYKPADTANWYQMVNAGYFGWNLYEDFVHSGDEATCISAVSASVNENEFWFSCLSDDTPGFYAGSNPSQANISSSTVNVFKFNPMGTLTDEDEEIGVNETIDVVYNIFPNPASEYICISSSMDANATVTFTNIAGQTVKVVNKNLTTGDNSIVINDLTSGVYFCTVTANGYSHTSKVVVK